MNGWGGWCIFNWYEQQEGCGGGCECDYVFDPCCGCGAYPFQDPHFYAVPMREVQDPVCADMKWCIRFVHEGRSVWGAGVTVRFKGEVQVGLWGWGSVSWLCVPSVPHFLSLPTEGMSAIAVVHRVAIRDSSEVGGRCPVVRPRSLYCGQG